jgi:hypothetical protein
VREILRGRRVLVARPGGAAGGDPERRLSALGAQVESAGVLSDALHRIDQPAPYDGLVCDRRLLGGEPDALLRAILKLQQGAAVVVLSPSPDEDRRTFPQEAALLPLDSTPEEVLSALADALVLRTA